MRSVTSAVEIKQMMNATTLTLSPPTLADDLNIADIVAPSRPYEIEEPYTLPNPKPIKSVALVVRLHSLTKIPCQWHEPISCSPKRRSAKVLDQARLAGRGEAGGQTARSHSRLPEPYRRRCGCGRHSRTGYPGGWCRARPGQSCDAPNSADTGCSYRR